MLREQLFQLIERFLYHFADRGGFETKFHFVGVELCHLGSFSDQPVQTVAFFVDDGQQFLPLFFGMPGTNVLSCREVTLPML